MAVEIRRWREGGEDEARQAAAENTHLSLCLLHPVNRSDCQIQMGHVVVVHTLLIPDPLMECACMEQLQ